MGTLYLRGTTWWIGFVGSDGRWHYKSSGYSVEDKEKARAALTSIEEQLRAGNRMAELGPLSVAEWGERWRTEREARVPKLWNAAKEWRALERLVLPALVDGHRFGRMRLADVRPRHALELVRTLKAGGLAPRSVANVWGSVHKLFQDAVVHELLTGNPIVLPDTEQPRRRDKTAGWRGTAVFTREEAEVLISSNELAEDRRVLHALALLAGLREGEVCDRRWRDYDTDADPLGRLSVHSSFTRSNETSKSTKTEAPRVVPVHPTLAAMLARWKLSGWRDTYGRKPKPEDFIVLNARGEQLNDNSVLKGLKRDLLALGLRHRRYQDMRRTFISLARGDGALKDVLRCVTHSGAGDIVDSYTTFDWATLCAAVRCLKLRQRGGKAARHA